MFFSNSTIIKKLWVYIKIQPENQPAPSLFLVSELNHLALGLFKSDSIIIQDILSIGKLNISLRWSTSALKHSSQLHSELALNNKSGDSGGGGRCSCAERMRPLRRRK